MQEMKPYETSAKPLLIAERHAFNGSSSLANKIFSIKIFTDNLKVREVELGWVARQAEENQLEERIVPYKTLQGLQQENHTLHKEE